MTKKITSVNYARLVSATYPSQASTVFRVILYELTPVHIIRCWKTTFLSGAATSGR
jgi:hypothetical protein